jgi:CheY-like chemotaxis protein
VQGMAHITLRPFLGREVQPPGRQGAGERVDLLTRPNPYGMNMKTPSMDPIHPHGQHQYARHSSIRAAPPRPEAQRAPARPGGAKRILLADDDPAVRQMLGRVLQSEQYEVSYARTGSEAAAKFVSNPPDLVLLDLNMPDKDGWQAFGLMCDKQPMVPVIVITARPHQQAQAIGLGVDALMEKPLNLPVLLEAIWMYLAETERERARRLTHPHFKTRFLNHLPQLPAPARHI